MTNPSRRKGTSAEVDLMKFLRGHGLDVERLRQAGAKDEGDLDAKIGGRPFVIEVKNVAKVNLAGHTAEAELEALHYQEARGLEVPPHHLVVMKRRGTLDVSRWYAATTVGQWLSQVEVPF